MNSLWDKFTKRRGELRFARTLDSTPSHHSDRPGRGMQFMAGSNVQSRSCTMLLSVAVFNPATRRVEAAKVKVKKLSDKDIKKYLMMGADEWAAWSDEDVANALGDIIPYMMELEDQLKNLKKVMGIIGDAKLNDMFTSYDSQILVLKDALIAKMKGGGVRHGNVIKKLRAAKPRLAKLLDELVEQETYSYDYIGKATKENIPRGFPKKELDTAPEVGVDEPAFASTRTADIWGDLKGVLSGAKKIWNRIASALRDSWMSVTRKAVGELGSIANEITRA